ncbi:MAG: DMT family transporter [Kineosporiaceae bacterium]
MAFVGGSAAVAAVLDEAPLSTAQAVRYAVACALLLVMARLARRRVLRPRGREWLWLAGVALTGLVLFNVALVEGSRHAEPAVLGVAVAAVPLVLALLGPVLEGRRPGVAVVAAAGVVTAGAVLVQGGGRSDLMGLAWALLVLGCEAAFTLLAVPVLRRHGPWGVSVHSTWLAVVMFAALAAVTEPPRAALTLTRDETWAVAYLAVAVTAVAFVLWYSAVGRLGAAAAGLLTGIAPVSAAVAGVILGGPAPGPWVWAGIAAVGIGLAVGVRASASVTRTGTPAPS